MKASELKVGDRIRLLTVPGEGQPGYLILRETRRVYRKILDRKRPVRICRVDEDGPWFHCGFRMRNGRIEHHWLLIMESDRNWKMVP
jgi:hypothetical protein